MILYVVKVLKAQQSLISQIFLIFFKGGVLYRIWYDVRVPKSKRRKRYMSNMQQGKKQTYQWRNTCMFSQDGGISKAREWQITI